MIIWTNLQQVLNELGKELKDRYKQELGDREINATQALSDSVEYRIDVDGTVYEVALDLLQYWKYVENGRRPGKFPPQEPIKRWIVAKPVLPQPDRNGKLPTLKQLTFLIQRAIAENGTYGQHPLENTVEQIMTDFDQRIEEAITRDILLSL